ncbi:DUF4167 domain-containing protein [Devosia sp.]|uniref:DUF4167 domain-containing protein n=1 Tax=Devosia sp. TaxID=1871048 RepID=UPI00326640EE
MRPIQQNNNNKNNNNNRTRGRNGGRKHVNPLSRNFESNGPDVKVRGNAAHIAEKYMQLARDAQSSGDSVMAENYLQHAEHYFRIVSAAQPQPFGQASDGDDYDDDMPEPNNRFSSPQPVQQQVEQDQDGGGQQQPQQNGNNGNGSQPRQEREQREFRQPREARTRPPGEVQVRPVVEAQPVVVAQVESEEVPVEAGADGEVRKVRERRPRRRRPTTEGADPAGAEQPDVGDLPAFITAGGTPNLAD